MADQGSEGLLSPWLRKKRLEAAKPFLKGRVLDYGCGSGSLAELVPSDHYLGVDLDEGSLRKASSRFKNHRFTTELSPGDEYFDSIVSLAVIEHMREPGSFLRMLSSRLSLTKGACIVVTTPHPRVGWIHDLGASLGLFSRHANEEHEELLDRATLVSAGRAAGLTLVSYQQFLFGANQLVVFERES